MISFALKYKLAKLYSAIQPRRVFDSHICLMYHSVYDVRKDYHDHFSVELSNFKQHMTELKQSGIDIVNFGEEPALENSVSITFDDGYKDNLTLVAPIMEELKIPYTVFMVSDFLSDQYSSYLGEEELKTLSQKSQAQIGAHGKSHQPLAQMSAENAKNELLDSKASIEKVLGSNISSMSFPHGSLNSDLVQEAKSAGYEHIGNSIALPNTNENDTLMINRIPVFEYDNAKDVLNKVAGKWDWMGNR